MIILLFYVSVFFIGLAFGSFLNCVIYRLHTQKSLQGRSQCPRCNKTIVWYDNIPVLSFLLLKRRCRYCDKPISWQYPLVELVMGLLFVFSVIEINNQLSIITYQLFAPTIYEYIQFILLIIKDWIIFFTLVFIFVYDIKYLQIEDKVLLPATIMVVILSLIITRPVFGDAGSQFIPLTRQLQNMGIAIIIPVGFFVLQYVITKGKGVGLGDARIGLFMGAVLGIWYNVLVALFFAYIIGAIISLILLIGKKKTLKSQVPLGPFLASGTLVAYMYGPYILGWYV